MKEYICKNVIFRSSLDSRSTEVHPPDPALPKGPPETDQSIVPQLLIDHYVSMIDPSRAQTVDNDIARHCAFSLPAVALTLGRSNWPLLKETYETLANDMQWKVRRTLASSIHELGVILGEEVAAQDLVPIFNGFIKVFFISINKLYIISSPWFPSTTLAAVGGEINVGFTRWT